MDKVEAFNKSQSSLDKRLKGLHSEMNYLWQDFKKKRK